MVCASRATSWGDVPHLSSSTLQLNFAVLTVLRFGGCVAVPMATNMHAAATRSPVYEQGHMSRESYRTSVVARSIRWCLGSVCHAIEADTQATEGASPTPE